MNEDDIWHCGRCETLLIGIVGDFVPMSGGGVCCITCTTQRCCETDAFQNVPTKKDDEAVALISGFSPELQGAMRGEDSKTPEETMRSALTAELCLAE